MRHKNLERLVGLFLVYYFLAVNNNYKILFIIEHRWCGKLTTGYILTNPQAEIKEKKTQKKTLHFYIMR